MTARRYAPLVLLAGCASDRSIFATVNGRATSIADLGWFVVIGFSVISLVMWILLAWAALRRRGTFDEHMPVGLDDGKSWIHIGGVLIPAVILAAFLGVSTALMYTATPQPHHAMRPDIRIIGHQWWWEIQYLGDRPDQIITTANELHIPTGRPVVVELESVDVIHSFWVPNLQGKVDLIPGMKNHIRLEANEPGHYWGQCGEYCGAQHAHMRLLVVAQSPDEYARWHEHEALAAEVPRDPKRVRGQEVFEAKACAMCHTIRGTRALGHVGPDLTHVAERVMIGSESFPMTHGYLAGWSTRAQSLKPGVLMPNLTTMTGEELDALQAYLMGLQ